ncbi:sulfotransferase domain-containing protein [Pseudomaricurvus alcaniphilus]|uniref:sulfotransferase domain-containing protein n=1 Tax=Pseudomaricurvus alcaniphilus TaxID=1166482 RepID=UPI001A9E1A66|nr:sulfotransferase domain-containing protein [Pseudomaricurvus alcaniphilus]NHN39577.1 sulfotransferase domain-containing protein [Pseudomaricurvus alcaniphilus]
MSFYALKIRLNQLSVWSSLLFRYVFPLDSGLVVVTGFPKSGTTWVCQLVAAGLSFRFDNKPIRPYLRNAVIHCHRSIKFLHSGFGRKKTVIYVVRDPRDVILSAYHATIDSRHRVNNVNELTRKVKNLLLDVESFEGDRSKIEFVKAAVKSFPGSPLPWGEHVDQALSKKCVVIVRYEDIVAGNKDELKKIFNLMGKDLSDQVVTAILDDYHFDRKRNETKGVKSQSGYYRYGRSGGHKKDMPQEAVALIEEKFESQMKIFGYL